MCNRLQRQLRQNNRHGVLIANEQSSWKLIAQKQLTAEANDCLWSLACMVAYKECNWQGMQLLISSRYVDCLYHMDMWRPWVGGEGPHPIDALAMGIYGPHFHSTLTPPWLWWIFGCWTTVATWRLTWVGGSTLWVCVWDLYFIAPHWLT